MGLLGRFLHALIPSWITNPAATKPSKSGIASLDGLRGLACLIVFNEHYVICYQSRDTQVWFMRVPFIRLLYYGKASVFIFFAISGYVLSYKPLRLMRTHSWLDFQKTMSSSFLRRGIRLYLPCLIVSFIVMLLTMWGFFDRSMDVFNTFKEFIFLKETPPPHLSASELWFGWRVNAEFIFSATIPFDKETNVLAYFNFDEHQWTIPQEFRCSMLVFGLLVATSRMRPLLRQLTIASFAFYAFYTWRFYPALFFFGMLFAELDLARQAYYARFENTHLLPESSLMEKHASRRTPRGLQRLLHPPAFLARAMWVTAFILGLWFISSPQEIQMTPNYLPQVFASWGVEDVDDTLLIIGALPVVWSVANCSSLAILFNNPVVSYLGKISYALYLVHGTVIKSLGYNILPWTFAKATGAPREYIELDPNWWLTVTDSQKVTAYLMGLTFVATTCFWLSDLFWRYVDIPSVTLARRIEDWLTKGADEDAEEDDDRMLSSGNFGARPRSRHASFTHGFADSRRRAATMGGSGDLAAGAGGSQDLPKRKNG